MVESVAVIVAIIILVLLAILLQIRLVSLCPYSLLRNTAYMESRTIFALVCSLKERNPIHMLLTIHTDSRSIGGRK